MGMAGNQAGVSGARNIPAPPQTSAGQRRGRRT